MSRLWKINGVLLPALPEYDREQFPYAVILASINRPEGHGYTYRRRYKLWLSSRRPWIANKSLIYSRNQGSRVRVFEPVDGKWQFRYDAVWPIIDFAVGSPFEEDLGNYALYSINLHGPWGYAPTAKLFWANEDIFYDGGTRLYFSGSQPEEVPDTHWDAAVAGLTVGKRLRAREKGMAGAAELREGVLHIHDAAAVLRGGILEVR